MSLDLIPDVNTPAETAQSADTVSGRFLRLILLSCGVMCLGGGLLFPFDMQERYWSVLFDMAHAPAFFMVFVGVVLVIDPAAVGLSGRFQPLVTLNFRRLVVLAVALCVLGALCEAAQSLVLRSPSLMDAAANCTGLLAAMFWCASRKTTDRRARWLLPVISLALVGLPGISPVMELRECFRQRDDFPLLASFERPLELNAWSPSAAKLSRVTEWASHGLYSMRIHGRIKRRLPGALMVWPIRDWSEYSQLKLDFHNPASTQLTLGISIADRQHEATGNESTDRYEKWFVIGPSATRTITIELSEVAAAPATRTMLMSDLNMLNIYMPEAKLDTSLFVDNIRLTRAESP